MRFLCPSLNISSKNVSLLSTNDGTTICGSYNLALRSLSPVQVYAFEYEDFANLNLSGFFYYDVYIHSTIALTLDKSGRFLSVPHSFTHFGSEPYGQLSLAP
jgi:hypothetical protein